MVPSMRKRAALLIANEMRRSADDIEELGMRLAVDRHMVVHHPADIQLFDLLTQRLRCLAAICEAPDMVQAVEDCPLGDLSRNITSTLTAWDSGAGDQPEIAPLTIAPTTLTVRAR